MIDPVQAAVGIVVLLITVGALLYTVYSRTNAVEKAGFGALGMLIIVSIMIPVFWIMESNGETQANVQQFKSSVAQGAALYGQYCSQCHGLNGQGLSGPKLNGSTTVNAFSDTDLQRIIEAGIPSTSDPTVLQMPAWLDQYGGPLTAPQIQYLFALIRSADPTYLAKNGYPSGSSENGFSQVGPDLEQSNPGQYATAIAQATSNAGTGQFGQATDMSSKTAVTINIITPPAGESCSPACFGFLNLKVKVGTKLTWVNKSSTPHTVTALKGLNPAQESPNAQVFDSGTTNLILPNATFSYTVTMAAYNANPDHTLLYYCQIHPGMVAELTIVK